MLAGTAQAWHEVLTDGRAWEERLDAPRFRQAFVILARTVRRWPAPVEFVEAMPKREQLALARDVRPASPEEAAAAMARIKAMLRTERAEPEAKPEPDPEPKPDLSAVEAELQKHYDRKRAAAGDLS